MSLRRPIENIADPARMVQRCVLGAMTVFALLIGLPVTSVTAAQPYQMRFSDPLKQPWRLSRYPELQGQVVRSLAEDAAGNLWFGHDNGVVRYDGLRWQQHGVDQGLGGGSVTSIISRADGTLVAGTDHGVFQFRGAKWRRMFPRGSEDDEFRVHQVHETSDGALWAGCEWGLLRLGRDVTTLFTAADYRLAVERVGMFDAVEEIPPRVLPFSRFFKGTGIKLADRTVAALGDDSPARAAGLRVGDRIVEVNRPEPILMNVLRQDAGHLLSMTVERFDSGDQESIEFTTRIISGRCRSPAIYSITEDGHGRIWLGANDGRVLMSDDAGLSWQGWSQSDGCLLGKRPQILETDNGEIWAVSMHNEGAINRYDGTTWSSEPLPRKYGDKMITSIAQTGDGSIWLTSANRVHRYLDGAWTSHDTRDLGIAGGAQQMLVASDGALWIAGFRQSPVRLAMSPDEFLSVEDLHYKCTDTSGAQWFIDPAADRIVRFNDDGAVSWGDDDGIISSPKGIAALPDHTVVVFGSHQRAASLAMFDGDAWQRTDFPHVAREFSDAGFTVTRDGRLWLSAKRNRHVQQRGGVVVGNRNQWQHTAPPTAPDSAAVILELPGGEIMLAGTFGVVVFDNADWRHVDDPLLEQVRCLDGAIDAEGTVWLATRSHGVLRFRNGQWTAFSTSDGLLSDEVTHITVGKPGDVWACTSDGLCRFDGNRFMPLGFPSHFGRQSLRADPHGIWIDGSYRIVRKESPPVVLLDDEPLKVDYGTSALVTWRGVDRWNRTSRDDLSWSYRIDDGAWSPYSNDSQLVLKDLAAGDHAIQVRARDSDFNQSEASDPLSVAVLPPLWMRPWFLLFCAAVLGIVLWQSASLVRRGVALRTTNRELEHARSRLATQFADKSAQFRAVCDASPVGIFVTDTSGKVTYVNPYLEQLVGMTSDSAEGFGWVNALHEDDRTRILPAWQRALAQNQAFHDVGRYVHDDGTVVWFDVVADRIERGGEVIGYVGAVENITEQLAASEKLKESNKKLKTALEQLESAQDKAIKRERLSALGQMSAGVAHDINNALAPLLTYAELLAGDESIKGTNREHVELIRLGVSDTAGIVRRLEHFYRESHNQRFLESLEMANVVTQVVEMTRPKWQSIAQQEGKCIEVRTDILANPVIDGHPAQIRALLTNLVFNAVDAIQGDGIVTVRLDQTSDHAILDVIDDGEGMTGQQLRHCMEPFFTCKDRGSGLGLSECHGVVRQHDGTIDIESKPGEGTRVRVHLPLAAQPVAIQSDAGGELATAAVQHKETSPADVDEFSPSSAPSVLYIDDDETVRRSTVALLKSCGITVETAADGPEGLARLDEFDFQLVICDQGLPGMDGIEVLQEIKRKRPELPVVMVSGWSMADVRDGVQPDDFLEKPVAFDKLLGVLQRHLPAIAAS